jgi:hypothetical protein
VGFLQNFNASSFDALVQARSYYQFILLTLLATGTLAHKAARYGPAIGVSLLELALWIWIVRPQWVRIPAEAYADRLMEAVDLLDRQTTAAP